MKISKIVKAVVVTCALGVTVSSAIAKQEGKSKGKGAERRASKENYGRQASEMPSGLQKYSGKKGQRPSGLQKMKDEDGQLTRGLENGGKKLKPSSKNNKSFK